MQQAQFEKIQDEQSTVRFSVNGIKEYPEFIEASIAIRLIGMLQNMRIIGDR